MGRLHYCLNGMSVTDQVIKFQRTRDSRDYLPIQLYYDDYKDHWYNQLEDYMDRITFESEFDFKLCRAVESFDSVYASELAKKNSYNFLGAFNGWFYKILMNWKSNVKTSAFRMKKRPAVQCPVCGRFVGRIDDEHLQHYKTLSDLPKFFVTDGKIYETMTAPRAHAVCWGDRTAAKMRALWSGDVKTYAGEKRRVTWPWWQDGKPMVVCPFTDDLLPIIDEKYLQSLPDQFSRYAEPMLFQSFIERHPTALIQSEVYSLDRTSGMREEDTLLRDYIAMDARVGGVTSGLDYASICSEKYGSDFEYAFRSIDECVTDPLDRNILKMVAGGYSIEDVADTLEMDKKEVRRRVRQIRENRELESRLAL